MKGEATGPWLSPSRSSELGKPGSDVHFEAVSQAAPEAGLEARGWEGSQEGLDTPAALRTLPAPQQEPGTLRVGSTPLNPLPGLPLPALSPTCTCTERANDFLWDMFVKCPLTQPG